MTYKDKELTLEVHDDMLSHLVPTSFDPNYGARPLKRVIQHLLENPLAEAVLSSEYKRGDVIIAKLVHEYI